MTTEVKLMPSRHKLRVICHDKGLDGGATRLQVIMVEPNVSDVSFFLFGGRRIEIEEERGGVSDE